MFTKLQRAEGVKEESLADKKAAREKPIDVTPIIPVINKIANSREDKLLAAEAKYQAKKKDLEERNCENCLYYNGQQPGIEICDAHNIVIHCTLIHAIACDSFNKNPHI